MKRWIHAATENIDQKIKDYLAAWAHDNVKANEDACSLKDFREQLKEDGLKYTDSRYDYYLACYNHMVSAKHGTKEKVNSNTSIRDRISDLEERIESLKNYIEDCKARGCYQDTVDEQIELEELKEQLNFAWQDDEAEWNYAREQQEFNPDGSLKLYGSTKAESDYVKADTWNVSEPSAVEYGKAMERGRKRMEERYAPFVVKSFYRSPTSLDTPGYVITLDADNEWILYPDDHISRWDLAAKKYLLYGPYEHNEIRYADSKFYRNQKLFSTNHFKWVDDAVSFLFMTLNIDPE